MPYRHLLHLLLPLTLIACQPAPPPATATATPTATHTTTPTSTPHPTTTPAPSATPPPPTPTPDAADYQLAVPGTDALLALMSASIAHYYDGLRGEYPDWERHRTEADQMDAAISAEFERHYPNGLITHEILISDLEWESSFWQPAKLPDLLADGIVAYLNVEKAQLRDGGAVSGPRFEGTAYQVELDGDSQAEWIMFVEAIEFTLQLWIAVDEPASGEYVQLEGDIPVVRLSLYFPINQIIAHEDLTGDGLTDVIVLYDWYAGGSAYITMAYMVQGGPNGFEVLTTIRDMARMPDWEPEFTLETVNAGEPRALLVSNLHRINWGCGWRSTDIYRWVGGIEQIETINLSPPDTAECALAQAVSLRDPVDTATAIQYLEHALALFQQDDESNADFEIFARYRLAIAYAAEGNDTAARQQLTVILEAVDDIPAAQSLAAYFDPIMSVSTINPTQLCQIPHDEEFDLPEAWEYTATFSAAIEFRLSYYFFPDAICPLDLSPYTSEVNDIPDNDTPDDPPPLIVELAASVYASGNLAATRQQLQQLLPHIEPGDYYAQHHITWLIALTHELEGHTPQAIQLYLALSQSQPPTLWSHLAAARLAPANH